MATGARVKRPVKRRVPPGLLKIHKAGESTFCNALIFSPHGHGKTHMLGTANEDERTSPILVLNFEGGTHTLAGSDVDVFDVHTWDDYNEAYEILSDPDCKYKSAGLDSMSETQIFGMLSILEKDTKRVDPDLMAQQDWGVILIQMRRLVRHFRDLPMHVFFTALAGDTVVPRLGTIRAPLLQGAFQKELPGIVDVVGYLAVEESDDADEDGTRFLLLSSVAYPKFQVKARTPWGVRIPSEIEDPSIGDLLDTLGYK